MHERKARMAELSDGVIVLPGGFGTLDESFELLTWNQLGLIGAPVVFLDVDGFFESAVRLHHGAVRSGFIKDRHRARSPSAPSGPTATDCVASRAAAGRPKWIEAPPMTFASKSARPSEIPTQT